MVKWPFIATVHDKSALMSHALLTPWLPPLAVGAAAAALFIWARRKANTPPGPGEVRLVPYTGLMFFALIVLLLCVAYARELLRGGG